ncbi:Mce-associated membrane protein OS=Streptomyces tendae OX=1932 GN=GUR47_10385 PE=4 SV=1 [Streptomyces tendae]
MRRARILTTAGLVLALAFCGTGAWTYTQARTDDALEYGRERDEALADGREGIAVLTTLDAATRQRAERSIRDWRAVSTGPLREELGGTEAKAGSSARGTVTEAAVTALDTRSGTAKLIATVRVEVTPAGTAKPATDRKRLEAVLSRTGEGEWKVRALSAVPVAQERGEER